MIIYFHLFFLLENIGELCFIIINKRERALVQHTLRTLIILKLHSRLPG
jgi:hypothetical protein